MTVIRSLANLALVGAILLWALLLGFVQFQRAGLCDDRVVGTLVAWFGATVAVILLVNWPFQAHARSDQR